ncbi:GntR family transcriptional regulator [Burkholderia sp. Nafp2/4-1b]|uniref:GntR family transcriptional regulator n=1 Tax=Burkholderia sp. Nafp2/4-1b TaxID=2116686 RepID=UPI000EF884DE|nr:winged helix-turn-helix domain-containing protein [Burkholderia sp. Nafp2/4-1b]RKT98983.1 GntR family transcriptional regulator [Burkholderia sp. Nafp2/4-1b]
MHIVSFDRDSSATTHSPHLGSSESWRPDFARIRGCVANAIADQIEEAIRAGTLRPGDRLPTQQAIADALGFHHNTVYIAFRKAAKRGLIRSFRRRGTFVLDNQPH